MPAPVPAPVRRSLVVMRHAKAEEHGASDLVRRLSDRGVADATEAGRWLVAQGIEPDAALVSAATRTEMTWETVSESAGWDVDVQLDEGLYDAGPETALDLVRRTDEGVLSLVVIGHNPTVAFLAQLLDDGEGDDDASTQMTLGFPTCAAAVMTYDGDWADLDEASASVVAFHVGRA